MTAAPGFFIRMITVSRWEKGCFSCEVKHSGKQINFIAVLPESHPISQAGEVMTNILGEIPFLVVVFLNLWLE